MAFIIVSRQSLRATPPSYASAARHSSATAQRETFSSTAHTRAHTSSLLKEASICAYLDASIPPNHSRCNCSSCNGYASVIPSSALRARARMRSCSVATSAVSQTKVTLRCATLRSTRSHEYWYSSRLVPWRLAFAKTW